MEILTTITALLSVAELFLSLKDRICKKSNKDQLSVWLAETADLIESVAHDLADRLYPHDKCTQMQFYLHNFYDIIKDDLQEDQAKKVLMDIEDAYKVERLLGELNNLDDVERGKNLNKMFEIAGRFRGLSEYLKFTK